MAMLLISIIRLTFVLRGFFYVNLSNFFKVVDQNYSIKLKSEESKNRSRFILVDMCTKNLDLPFIC